jgi:competence ComEA-like helix-hairpin-helix protein
MNFSFGPSPFPISVPTLDPKEGVASVKIIGTVKASKGNLRLPRSPKPFPPTFLDLNRATEAELMTLPGIGPALAERIVRYREENGPFADASQIKEISGIGEKRYERIKQWIRVGAGNG